MMLYSSPPYTMRYPEGVTAAVSLQYRTVKERSVDSNVSPARYTSVPLSPPLVAYHEK